MWWRKRVRAFACWLEPITSEWVVPHEFYAKVADKDLNRANGILSRQEKLWSRCDPALVKANVVYRMNFNKLQAQQERNK